MPSRFGHQYDCGLCGMLHEGRKLYQISYDERIDAFLLSGGIQKTQAHFYVVTVGKPTVFRGRASFSGGAVIPVNPQQWRVLRNALREGFPIPSRPISRRKSANRGADYHYRSRAPIGGEKVTRIHEDCNAIHALTSYRSALFFSAPVAERIAQRLFVTCNLLKFKAEFRSQNWPKL